MEKIHQEIDRQQQVIDNSDKSIDGKVIKDWRDYAKTFLANVDDFQDKIGKSQLWTDEQKAKYLGEVRDFLKNELNRDLEQVSQELNSKLDKFLQELNNQESNEWKGIYSVKSWETLWDIALKYLKIQNFREDPYRFIAVIMDLNASRWGNKHPDKISAWERLDFLKVNVWTYLSEAEWREALARYRRFWGNAKWANIIEKEMDRADKEQSDKLAKKAKEQPVYADDSSAETRGVNTDKPTEPAQQNQNTPSNENNVEANGNSWENNETSIKVEATPIQPVPEAPSIPQLKEPEILPWIWWVTYQETPWQDAVIRENREQKRKQLDSVLSGDKLPKQTKLRLKQLDIIKVILDTALSEAQNPKSWITKLRRWWRSFLWLEADDPQNDLAKKIQEFYSKEYPAILRAVLDWKEDLKAILEREQRIWWVLDPQKPLILSAIDRYWLDIWDPQNEESVMKQYQKLIEFLRRAKHYEVAQKLVEDLY